MDDTGEVYSRMKTAFQFRQASLCVEKPLDLDINNEFLPGINKKSRNSDRKYSNSCRNSDKKPRNHFFNESYCFKKVKIHRGRKWIEENKKNTELKNKIKKYEEKVERWKSQKRHGNVQIKKLNKKGVNKLIKDLEDFEAEYTERLRKRSEEN